MSRKPPKPRSVFDGLPGHIAVLRVHKTMAADRATTIRAWLRRRGVKPLALHVEPDGDDFIVAIGFASPADTQALAKELGVKSPMIDSDDLRRLAQSPVFLLREFFESIDPIAACIVGRSSEQQQEFFLRLFPYLIAACRELELPHAHETSLFLVQLIRDCAGSLTI